MRGALLCGNGLGLSDSRWGTLASGFMGAKDEVGLHNVCVCLELRESYTNRTGGLFRLTPSYVLFPLHVLYIMRI